MDLAMVIQPAQIANGDNGLEQFTSSAIEFLDRPPLNKNPTLGDR